IFIFWRRDLRNQQVKLPGNLALAGLGRRSVAGFIDLVPVLVIVSSIFHIGPAELFAKHWPGEGSVQSLQTMAPGLWTIGIFVIYTGTCELIFKKTAGKWIAGLRVTDLSGQKPTWWRIVVRCLLKIL